MRTLLTMVVLGVSLALTGMPAAAADVRDDFDGPVLDGARWSTCQADPRLLSFGREGSRTFLAVSIDHERGDVETCAAQPPLSTERERLGPGLIPPRRRPLLPDRAWESCPTPEIQNGRPLVQRNELRFRPDEYRHPVDAPHWYSISFKLAGEGGDPLPDCGSARWVIAQWKYTDDPEGSTGSPFLAQRFDNGVLHVTIEDGDCRCLVAKSDGDPDRLEASAGSARGVGFPVSAVSPLACRSTGAGPDEGRPCQPRRLKLFCAGGEGIPPLPDPKKDWVRMTYRIQGHRVQGTRIDIYANGRFIVRAQGNIAEGLPMPNRVKFKFGHYRDKIPVSARLMVDDVCLAETAAACDPTLNPAAD